MQNYPTDIPNGFIPFSGTWNPVIGTRLNNGRNTDKGPLTHLTESIDKHQQPSPSTPTVSHQIKQDENRLSSSKEIVRTIFPNSPSLFSTPDNVRTDVGLKTLYESMPQPSLSYSIGNNALTTSKPSLPPNPSGIVNGREPEKVPSFKQGQRSRLTFPKPSKSGVNIRLQSNKGAVSENRVARPPVEGRGRNQLLPRYWPKITDQELLEISGEYPWLFSFIILRFFFVHVEVNNCEKLHNKVTNFDLIFVFGMHLCFHP